MLEPVNLTPNTTIIALNNGGLISLLDAGSALKFQIVNLDLSYIKQHACQTTTGVV